MNSSLVFPKTCTRFWDECQQLNNKVGYNSAVAREEANLQANAMPKHWNGLAFTYPMEWSESSPTCYTRFRLLSVVECWRPVPLPASKAMIVASSLIKTVVEFKAGSNMRLKLSVYAGINHSC